MKSLIAKLEQANEGSRELDWDIARSIYPSLGPDESVLDEVFLPDGPPLPHYTTSIDAALTLVQEGWGFWHLSQYSKNCNNKAEAHIYNDRGEKDAVQADAATPALALCIASLKALE